MTNFREAESSDLRVRRFVWDGEGISVLTHEYPESYLGDGLCWRLLPLDAPFASAAGDLLVTPPREGHIRVVEVRSAWECGGVPIRVVVYPSEAA